MKERKNYFSIGVKAFFHGKTWKRVIKHRFLYLLVLPAVALVLLFNYVPMFGIVTAFQDYRLLEGVGGSEWVGLKQFYNLFISRSGASSYRFIRNTLYISLIRIGTNFPAILIFALLLGEIKNPRARGIMQTVSYVPYFISWVAVGGIARTLFDGDTGILNKMIELVGGTPKQWYIEQGPWWAILALSSLWKAMGWCTLIYISTMGNIDSELYDACQIDGGGRFRQAITVTLPGLGNVICMQLLLDSASVLSDNADQIISMTQNSPSLSNTNVIGTSVIDSVLGGTGYAAATAIGLVQGLVGLVMVLIVNGIVKKTENEGIL